MANGCSPSAPTATWPAWSGRPAKCAGRRICGRITAASRGTWAYSESPLIDGEVGGLHAGRTECRRLVALNKKTGELIWKCAVPGGDQAAYASALVIEAGGVRQYVQMLQKGLVGVEAKTGKLLWRYDRDGQRQPGDDPDAGGGRGFHLQRRGAKRGRRNHD